MEGFKEFENTCTSRTLPNMTISISKSSIFFSKDIERFLGECPGVIIHTNSNTNEIAFTKAFGGVNIYKFKKKNRLEYCPRIQTPARLIKRMNARGKHIARFEGSFVIIKPEFVSQEKNDE